MKKIIIGLCLIIIGAFGYSQNGLKDILVEKYYVSNAADNAYDATLPVGSVTYRLYAEMLPGYTFEAAYGITSPSHELRLQTTTSFFNNSDYGTTAPTFSKTNAAKGTVMLDSWLSAGAACAGNFGIVKTEDDGVNTVVNANGILKNNDPKAGIPLSTQDGLLAGSPQAVTFVGLDAIIGVFNDGSANGNLFSTTNGSWASLNGSTGPTSTNRVLIAQITTDGIFTYQLNIQIGTPIGGVQNYVAKNPVGNEISGSSYNLIDTLGRPNILPTISITAPTTGANYLTGDVVNLSATANDKDGTISTVEYFVDGSLIGVSASTANPYLKSWTSTEGLHSITAKATDNDGGQTTSTAIYVNVTNHIAPTISITAPTAGTSYNVGNTVTITTNPVVFDGTTISSVEFFVNGSLIATLTSSPWTTTWAAVEGTPSLTAKVTDSRGTFTTSAAVGITVTNPNGPPYQITSTTSPCNNLLDFFCLPIKLTRNPLMNCIGFDVVMQFNPTKVTPTGLVTVYSDMINPTYTAYAVNVKDSLVNVSVFLNSTAPVGTGFNGLGKAFCVEFATTTNFKAADTATLTVTSLVESYVDGTTSRLVKPGSYITYKDSIFTGSLNLWANNSPIKYDAANPGSYLITNVYGNNTSCSSKSTVAVQPDLTGNFRYVIKNGQYLDIERDIANTTDVLPVINGYDALLTQKVLVNDPSFSPNIFQMIAMDVNMDGVISAGDLSQINQRAVLMIPEFKQAWNYDNQGYKTNSSPSKDWLFIDTQTLIDNLAYRKSSTYPANDGVGYSKYKVPVTPFCIAAPITDYSTCPSVTNGEEYKGILLGDIDGNYKDISNDGLLKRLMLYDTSSKIVFDMSNAVINGNHIDVPVYFSSSDTINSLDFSMQFNQTDLKYDTIINHASYLNPTAFYNSNDQTLRFTSYSLQDYQPNVALVSIRFNLLSSHVNSSDLYTLKGYLNGSLVKTKVTTITGIEEFNKNQNVRVYPNPASSVLNVEVSEKSNIQVFDMSGKQVLLTIEVIPNQKQKINIENFANGIYTIKIYNDKFVTVKKVVINR